MESLLMGVVALALLLACAMGVIAWRVLRRDRARDDARVALLRSLADTPGEAVVTTHAPDLLLGAAVRPAGTTGWAIAMMALIGLSTGVGVTYGVYRPSDEVIADAAPVTRPPLELVALSHARSDESTFRISGVIANPPGGAATTRLMAVVSLFDNDGGYLETVTALVAFPTVAAGDESPFTLQVPTRARIARYRLVFREEQGGPLVHVDRRHTRREGGPSDIDVSRP